MTHSTVRLQVSHYSQLSDYNFTQVQNTAVYAPIKFEEIVVSGKVHIKGTIIIIEY